MEQESALSRLQASATSDAGLAARLKGPGGLYNIGNAIGLLSGLGFQLLAVGSGDAHEAGAASAVAAYLFGSPGATALTVATIVFFISGETYHRASAGRSDEDPKLVRRADFLSGLAALFLAISLALFGSFWLALTSTVLLAGGKFGNALTQRASWPVRFELVGFDSTTRTRSVDLFRLAALLSRVPAVIAIAVEILRLGLLPDTPVSDLCQSSILLICFCFWMSADLSLFNAGGQRRPAP